MKPSSRTLATLLLLVATLLAPRAVDAQWQGSVSIDQGTIGDAVRVQLAMNANGRSVVVWEDAISTNDVDIWANNYARGQGFRGAENIETS